MTRVTDELHGTDVWSTIGALARLERAQRTAEDTAEIRTADRRLLWLLSDGTPRTMREIAEELSLEQSTVNRQVNAALTAGLLARVDPDAHHARPLVVTDEGRALFDRSLERHVGLLDQALAAVPDDRRAAFLADLAAFVDAYGSAVDAS